MWFVLLSSVQAESLYLDSTKSDWLIGVTQSDDRVFLAGKRVEENQPNAWMVGLEEEVVVWDVEGIRNSEIYAIDAKDEMVVGCGLRYVDPTIIYGTETPFLWAVNTDGQTIFEVDIDADIIGTCSKVVATEVGWVVTVVQYDPNSPGSVVYTIDDLGQVLNQVNLPNPVEVYGLKKAGDNLALAGFVPNDGDVDGWLGVMTTSGEVLWEQTFGGEGIDKLKNVFVDDNNHMIACGYTTSNGAEDWDLWFVSTTMDGTVRFNTRYGGDLKDGCKNIQSNPSGDYLFAGDTESFGSIDWNALTGTLDANGSVVELHNWGEAGDDYFYDSIAVGKEHYWVGTSERDGERDGWILIQRGMHNTTPNSTNPEKVSGCNSFPLRPLFLSIFSVLFVRWR